MAARANFHAYQFALVRRARLKRAPARAMYFHSVVFRMYSLFHAVSPVYPERFPRKAYPICPRSRFLALNAGPVGTGARARRGAQRTLPVARSADNLSSYANLSRLPIDSFPVDSAWIAFRFLDCHRTEAPSSCASNGGRRFALIHHLKY